MVERSLDSFKANNLNWNLSEIVTKIFNYFVIINIFAKQLNFILNQRNFVRTLSDALLHSKRFKIHFQIYNLIFVYFLGTLFWIFSKFLLNLQLYLSYNFDFLFFDFLLWGFHLGNNQIFKKWLYEFMFHYNFSQIISFKKRLHIFLKKIEMLPNGHLLYDKMKKIQNGKPFQNET